MNTGRIVEKGAPRGRTDPEPLDGDDGREAPLPVLRLRRLGVSVALVEHLAGMWEQMTPEAADAASAAMRDMSDRELLVALVGEPEDGDDPAAWAAAAAFPDDAARVVAMPR